MIEHIKAGIEQATGQLGESNQQLEAGSDNFRSAVAHIGTIVTLAAEIQQLVGELQPELDQSFQAGTSAKEHIGKAQNSLQGVGLDDKNPDAKSLLANIATASDTAGGMQTPLSMARTGVSQHGPEHFGQIGGSMKFSATYLKQAVEQLGTAQTQNTTAQNEATAYKDRL